MNLKNFGYGFISMKYELFWRSNVVDYFQMEVNEGEAQPTREFITDKTVVNIVEEIKTYDSEIVIIDLDDIASADKVFHYFTELNKIIVLINVSPKLRSIIISECNDIWSEWIDNTDTLVLSSKLKILETVKYYDMICDCNNAYTTKIVDALLSNDIYIDMNKYNESSNVYLSNYINIKKIYAKPDMLNFCLYGLYRYIMKYNSEFDCFVCTSNNGAVLASVLGAIFRKKVLYLLNLGPKIIINEKDLWRKIEKNKKYFYVYDILCLGTELKILNVVLNMHRAELVGGMGIGRVLPMERYSINKNYEALVDINKFRTEFNYSISLYDTEEEK
jgi:hypothetical protein